MERWARRWVTWVRFSFLEGRLSKKGYRRLQSAQAEDARDDSRKLLHEVADVLLRLQAVTEHVESSLTELKEPDG